MNAIVMLSKILTKQDKFILCGLLVLSMAISCAEMLSITAIMMFISIATNFDLIFQKSYYVFFYNWYGFEQPAHFVMTFGIFLACFYVVRAFLNLVHTYCMGRFAYTRYHRFATLSFARLLRFSYQDFVSHNSAHLHQSIFSNTGTLSHLIFALLTLTAELCTVMCIYGMLFYVNWKMTLALSCFLGISALFLIKIFSQSVTDAGKKTQHYSLEGGKVFNEAIGNFKLIKLHVHENLHAAKISYSTQHYSTAQTVYVTLQNMPRFILETIGFLLLVGIIITVLYRYNNASSVIPMVSLYAVAFYRLLPSLNKILASINQIGFYKHALQSVFNFLQLPTEDLGANEISFKQKLCIENVSFSYDKKNTVLKNVTMHIAKGQRIALIGPSGAGKSTLVDIIMGLYIPDHGSITVDKTALDDACRRTWRKKIGYIPQTIYLFDGTVADNVVFGRDYDESKVIIALQKAHIYDFLSLQQGLNTRVGEGGIKLSGGQKQRIAIARALYSDPELLVLDEATSSLDHETESGIMDQMYQINLDVTMIIVAHRTTTIARCDTVYKIEQGIINIVEQLEKQHVQTI